MLLSYMAAKYPPLNEIKEDHDIKKITSDSRKADGESLFVCISGAKADGHDFASSAYGGGCRYFAAEKPLKLPDDANVFIFPDTRIALAELSHAFYGYPSEKLKVIGITGTKGKTTTANLIYHVLKENGKNAAYIGTNGILFNGKKIKTSNTTPESIDLAYYMSQMAESGVEYLALEVSSQALYLNRVRAVKFDSLIYTNLYPDHIGGAEHPTFEHYRDSKKRLFSEFDADLIFTNKDDLYSDYMTEGRKKTEYSVMGDGQINASEIRLYRQGCELGVEFDASYEGEKERIKLPMPGIFNIHNALAAIGVCRKYGIGLKEIAASLKNVRIDGRFTVLDTGTESTFVIDYAHNGASLENVLRVLREYDPERLICLFGSVGGRTKTRRSELAKAASKLCDYCILSSDNPDFEDPEAIIEDIAENMGDCPYEKIPDRREAIERAVAMSKKGDIILLAGKGHEDYQLIRGVKEPFFEREIIFDCLKRVGV